MNNITIIILNGGLGNQLFQYSLYLWLKKIGRIAYLFNGWYYLNSTLPHEQIKLNYFNVVENVYINMNEAAYYIDISNYYSFKQLFKAKIKKNLFFQYLVIKLLRKITNNNNIKYVNKNNIFIDDSDKMYEELIMNKPNINYICDGVFARLNHIVKIIDELDKKIIFSKKLNEPYVSYYESIKSFTSVAVHVRRGDYVGNATRDICNMSYYKNAINILSKKYNNLHFFVFSDDIQYISENFTFLKCYTIIDSINELMSDYFDLFLMTKVNHLILSNSTFSWWGAWLNKSNGKTVIVPDHYHSDNSWIPIDEIFPSEWIRLPLN